MVCGFLDPPSEMIVGISLFLDNVKIAYTLRIHIAFPDLLTNSNDIDYNIIIESSLIIVVYNCIQSNDKDYNGTIVH